MATAEERLKILKMVQDGKITAEEAVQLIEILDGETPGVQTARQTTPPPARERNPRWVRVCVTDTNTGKARVNVRLPVTLVSAGMKMGARFSPEVQGLDMDQLMQSIQAGETGRIVDAHDENDGERVEVYLE